MKFNSLPLSKTRLCCSFPLPDYTAHVHSTATIMISESSLLFVTNTYPNHHIFKRTRLLFLEFVKIAWNPNDFDRKQVLISKMFSSNDVLSHLRIEEKAMRDVCVLSFRKIILLNYEILVDVLSKILQRKEFSM